MRFRRTFAAVGVACAAALAAASPATANNPNNVVSVANERDGAYAHAESLRTTYMRSDVVEPSNVAYAYARCADCQTVAAAVHVVLASGSPSRVAPRNAAIAVNDNCTSCRTLASAHQFVVVTAQRMTLSENGADRIEDLAEDLEDALESRRPLEEIEADVDAIAADVNEVLRTELVRRRVPGHVRHESDDEIDVGEDD